MTTLAWQEARRQAEQLRRDFDTSDPWMICDGLGITVIEAALPEGVSGMIDKPEGDDAQIFIEARDVPGRRRFTCAHELGHFIERTNVAHDREFSFRDKRGGVYNLHEFFADEFAGELLMPGADIRRRKNEGYSLTDLARLYGVTVRAVERRLKRLEKNPPQTS